jgi:hypothetical protein
MSTTMTRPCHSTRLTPIALTAALFAGCAAAPKTTFFVPEAHPALAKSVRVLADGCVQRRVLVGANHFVLDQSDAVAQALDANARGYLERRGIAAPGASAVSVCGVLGDPQNPEKTFADVVDGPTRKQAPPLKVSAALAAAASGLPPLLAELQSAAQRALAAAAARDKGEAIEPPTLSPAARELAATLAAPDHQLLFVGVSGNSESGGKFAAQLAALTVVAVAASIVAAPAAMTFTGPTAGQMVATQATTQVGVGFMATDGALVVGALVDTRSGRIEWAHAAYAQADPMKEDVLSRGLTTERVLATLLNREAPNWSPPGRGVAAAPTRGSAP